MWSDHERLHHQTHIMGAGTWNVLELLSASSDTRWFQKTPSAPVFVFISAIRPGISLAGKAGLLCRTHAGPLRAQLLCHSCLIFKEPFDVCGRATDARVSHRKPASQNRHSGAHQSEPGHVCRATLCCVRGACGFCSSKPAGQLSTVSSSQSSIRTFLLTSLRHSHPGPNRLH